MMKKSQYTPVRPPRGSKVSKDTSGRLMNIIAELSVSKNNEDRKRKMFELKKDFDACDARLVELISGHREELSITMESFSEISCKIKSSRTGCRLVTEKLSACKKLLECKRDEIRRLRSESVEHGHVISMLREINSLNAVNEKFEEYLKEENFLKATELLVSSLNLLNGKLSGAEGLKDLKSELNSLRKKLLSKLVEEIHKHLYMNPDEIFLSTSLELHGKSKSYEETFSAFNRHVLKLPLEGTCDIHASDTYENIAVILKCIARLNSLSETVEILKENTSKELMKIVRNSTEVMYSMIPENSTYSSQIQPLFSEIVNPPRDHQPTRLLDLTNSILHQFRQVAVNHYAFLDNLERISMTNALTDVTEQFEIADVLSKLQAAVELFVVDYLDLHSAVTQRNTAAFFAKVPTAFSDISSFFLRKNVVRTKKQTLFKFDGSSHAINKKTYLQEQKEKEKGELNSVEVADEKILVCEPSSRNITLIYKTLRKFIAEIEAALEMEPGNLCPLHSFLIDSVKVFLDEVSIDINRMLDRITTSLETSEPVTDPDEMKLFEAKTPILKSTVALNSCLIEMQELINALPDYSSYFLQLICHVLQSYKDLSYGAYKSLIYPDSEDQRIFSLTWTKDDDISRLLRSLPNWITLKIHDDDSACEGNFQESPEEIRFRNKEESELLIRNLSFAKDSISINEIISDHKKLRQLALMHESMEWFSSRILTFAESLPDIQGSVKSLMPDKLNDENDLEISSVGMTTKASLRNLAESFEDLADTCLLVIHLDIRAHCFYYLLQLCKQGYTMNRKDDEEPEPEILKLNADLAIIDESLSPVLQLKKMRYIFEGLGELISTILINSICNMKKINENKVKKMGRNIFAIQQNLAGITMTREVALDRARQYFELLNHTYEDILNQIVEEGPQFQEHEYSSLIQLLHNSREGIYDQEPVAFYLEKLRQILDEVAVSV